MDKVVNFSFYGSSRPMMYYWWDLFKLRELNKFKMSILTKITGNNTLPLTGHEKETFILNLKNITIFSLIVFFCSCKNIKVENEIVTNLSGHAVDSVLLNAKDRMFKIHSIQDSLIRKKETGLKLLLCEFIEDKDYYYYNFSINSLPVYITCSYIIFEYENFYVLLGRNTPISNSPKDSLTKSLIQQGLITFEKQRPIQEDYNFINFIICKNDNSKIGVYNNLIINDSLIKFTKKHQFFSDSIFYPKCK